MTYETEADERPRAASIPVLAAFQNPSFRLTLQPQTLTQEPGHGLS